MLRWPAISSLSRLYAVPVMLQALGTAATLGLTIGLARYAGPEIQAIFVKYRYWTDLCISLTLFGLPQAYVYAINKKHISTGALSILSGAYAASAFIPIMFAAWLSLRTAVLTPIPNVQIWITASATAGAVSMLIYQRLERSVQLSQGGYITFSMITALPSLSLAGTYILIYGSFSEFRYDILYLIAAAISLALSFFLRRGEDIPRVRSRVRSATQEIRSSIGVLFTHSTHSVLQAALLTAQPAISALLIERFGGHLQDISFFNIATLAVVLCNLLFQYMTPLLFNRWSMGETAVDLRRPLMGAAIISLLFGIAAAATLPLLPDMLVMGLGPEYRQAGAALQIVALASAPVVFTRVLSPAIHATGRPDLNSISGAARLVVVLVAQVGLMLAGASPLLAAAFAWLIGEWLAAAVVFGFSLHLGGKGLARPPLA